MPVSLLSVFLEVKIAPRMCGRVCFVMLLMNQEKEGGDVDKHFTIVH